MAKKNRLLEAQLAPLRTELQAKRDAALAGLQPLCSQRDALIAEMQPVEAKLRALQAEIKTAEAPLREIGNNLAALERAIGATSLTLDAGQTAAEPGTLS
jgi:hypothetical protein